MATSDKDLDEIVVGLNLKLQLFPEPARTKDIGTFHEFREFIQQEIAFWDGTPLQEIRAGFRKIFNELEQTRQTDRDNARTSITRAVNWSQSGQNLIYSSTAWGGFLKGQAIKHPQRAQGAFVYYKGQGVGSSDPQMLIGFVAASLFAEPDILTDGLSANVAAFTQQRTEITSYREALARDYTAIKDEEEKWKKSKQGEAATLLAQIKSDLGDEQARQSGAFDESHEKWKKDIANLEDLYREKTRLKEPAEYWNSLDKQYTRQGRFWVTLSTILIISIAIALFGVAYRPPDIFDDTKMTLGGFKGAVLITAGISILLFLLNIFVKLSTSSYHLARDARERYQLTHVFLALINEKAIEPKDREIILPALFSRSDTGLLKHDAGPHFPTPLSTIMDGIRGHK